MEGGYFTDFVKGHPQTHVPNLAAWLGEVAQDFVGKTRFDVYMSILQHELESLNDAFGLDNADKYIIIWDLRYLKSLIESHAGAAGRHHRLEFLRG